MTPSAVPRRTWGATASIEASGAKTPVPRATPEEVDRPRIDPAPSGLRCADDGIGVAIATHIGGGMDRLAQPRCTRQRSPGGSLRRDSTLELRDGDDLGHARAIR